MNNKLIWLWLSLHFDAGSRIFNGLYSHFGSVEAIYDCDDADLASIDWLKNHEKKKLLDKNTDHAEQVLDWCDYYDVDILTPEDDNYPYPLRSLTNYPAVIYCKGIIPDFKKQLCISVVGTRKMTNSGKMNAYELGYGLTKGGALVVSGMAAGIDCTAQKGALYAGGSTVAVLGCGINVVFPKENFELMKKIMKVGCVITEYPPNTPPNGFNFPVRNRLISALSSATVVVEADENSGALITARKAAEQGKDLFAFPGPVKNFSTSGNNLLLSQGAKVATCAIDILEYYLDVHSEDINLSASKEKPSFGEKTKREPIEYKEGFFDSARYTPKRRNDIIIPKKEEVNRFDASKLGEKEKSVYDSMEYDKPISTETLANMGMDIEELASILTMLEIMGAVSALLPGGYYLKK